MSRSNIVILEKRGKLKNFLLDSSAICRIEELYMRTGVNLLEKLTESEVIAFFVMNDVICELSNVTRAFDIDVLYSRMINSEASLVKNRRQKMNTFVVNRDSKPEIIEINSISLVDWAQINLCLNHNNLILVSNDRKMLRSGSKVLRDGRAIGFVDFIDFCSKIHPDSEIISLDKLVKSLKVKPAINDTETKKW